MAPAARPASTLPLILVAFVACGESPDDLHAARPIELAPAAMGAPYAPISDGFEVGVREDGRVVHAGRSVTLRELTAALRAVERATRVQAIRLTAPGDGSDP